MPGTAPGRGTLQEYACPLAAYAPLVEKSTKHVNEGTDASFEHVGRAMKERAGALRETRGCRLRLRVREGCSEQEPVNWRTEGLISR